MLPAAIVRSRGFLLWWRHCSAGAASDYTEIASLRQTIRSTSFFLHFSLRGLLVDRMRLSGYRPAMTTTLFTNGRSQAVRIPKELRFEGREVSIRRLGDGVLLVPVKASTWPEGFFKSIRIDDANFTRPEQGELPPIVEFTA